MTETDIARRLRERAASVPELTVDTTGIIPAARRRRATRRVIGAVTVTAVVAGGGWLAADRPWQEEIHITTVPPATSAPSPTVVPAPSDPPESAATILPAGQFWYVRTHQTSSDASIPEQANESWATWSEEGLWVHGFGEKGPGEVWTSGPITSLRLLVDGEMRDPTVDVLDALPTDPVTLTELLNATIEADPPPRPMPIMGAGDHAVLGLATRLLTEAPASTELRRALWTVIEDLPGMETPIPTTDTQGRPGTAIVAPIPRANQGYLRWTVIVDETTSTLLEVRYEAVDALEPSTVVVTVLDAYAVDAPPFDPSVVGCQAWDGCAPQVPSDDLGSVGGPTP